MTSEPDPKSGSGEHGPKRPKTEFELISWIRQRAAAAAAAEPVHLGIGDDCASIRFAHGAEMLATTDMLIDGRHFRLEGDKAEDVGYKALAVNLSDIAAMAGIPLAALVSVALPRESASDVAQGLLSGLLPLAKAHKVTLVGGDTNAWDGPLVISVTLLGEATGLGSVRREGAQPGDAIFVTGPLGGSLLNRHLRPTPRVLEAQKLHAKVGRNLHAMIDISDGLAADLGHILEESGGLGAIFDACAIPIHPDAHELAKRDGRTPLAHALHDGEDFELCLAVEPSVAELLLGAFDGFETTAQLALIGEITREPGLRLRHADGRVDAVVAAGFDHLASQENA